MANYAKRVIDAGLASIRLTERSRARILQNALDQKKVKRRLSAGLVLIIVLILASVTALAATGFFDYIGTLLQKEQSQGPFQQWPEKDKIELVRQLKNNGYLTSDSSINQLLVANIQDEDAGRLAENILANWLDAPVDHVAFRPVIEKIWGDFRSWTLEQKAWFTKTMIDTGIQQPDFEKYVLPGPEHISQETAIRSAQSAAEIWLGIPTNSQIEYEVIADFVIFPENRKNEIGLLTVTTEGVQPCWFVQISSKAGTNHQEVSNCAVTVDAFTGKVDVQYFIGKLQYERFGVSGEPSVQAIQRTQGSAAFFEWTLDAKAEWSKKVRPIVLEKENIMPGCFDYATLAFSKYIYGLPDETAIKEPEAMNKAKEAILQTYQVNATSFDLYNLIYTYYDVSTAGQTKWRFHVSAAGRNTDDLTGNDCKHLINYRVEIDAHTGEVLTIEAYDQSNYTGIDAIVKWL